MSSSKAPGPRQVPPPPNSRAGTPYTRFIPREELHGFANWTPGAFGGLDGAKHHAAGAGGAAAADGDAPAAGPEEVKAALQAARQAGYADGYRDGLVALESFKQSLTQQMSGQFAPLLQSLSDRLGALEQQIAETVATVAVQLARQVVRSELDVRPELVCAVASEAVNAVLLSARSIVVQVHPDDHALIASSAGEALAARGARLVAQHGIARGGCLLETDAGIVDARIESRWNDAVCALGTAVPWCEPGPDIELSTSREPERR
jgi:flagellar assembly protein FliH